MKVTKYFDKHYKAIIANAFVKKGYKAKSIAMYNDLLISLKNLGIKDPESFIKFRLLELQPIVNLRSIKLGGIKYKIPYLIKEQNQLTLASVWLTRIKNSKNLSRSKIVKNVTDNFYQIKEKKGNSFLKQQEWYATASRNRPYLKYLRD